MTRLFTPLIALSLVIIACSDPTAPAVTNLGAQNQPAHVDSLALPIGYVFKAENPCTSRLQVYTIAATAFTTRLGNERRVIVKGTVKSNDDFIGYLEASATFKADRQLLSTGEFHLAHEKGRIVGMTVTFLYNDDVRPMIAVEHAQPVGCSVEPVQVD